MLGEPYAEPDLANVRKCLAPEFLDLFQVARVVLCQLAEQAGIAFLCRQQEQSEEVEQWEGGEDADGGFGRVDALCGK